jgi:hypothetical protein
MVRISQEEHQRIRDLKELDIQQCSYCQKITILNLGWKTFGKFNCRKHEQTHILCWELCHKVCLNILGCELSKKKEKSKKKEQGVSVNQEYYQASCYLCSKKLKGAGKHSIIKNRNNPGFWGISSVYKILCLGCVGKRFYGRMVGWQRKKFRKYVQRGYV